MNKIESFVLLMLIIALIPFSKGIGSPLMNNDSNYLSIKKLLQENINLPFNSSVDEAIAQFMLEGHIPSLAASVVYKDNIIWSKGYGEQSNENVAFMIGSITKTITATALLQLYERGLFELDEDVSNYLPFSLRNPNYPNMPITFRSLLLHQSSLLRGGKIYQTYVFNDLDQKEGITNESLPSFPAWIDDVIFSSESQNTTEVWGTWAPGEKQVDPHGRTRLAYSNLGYDLLGYLVERLSNQTIEEYFKSNIFNPLNMTNTYYTYQSYPSDEVAFPYEWIPDEENVEDYPTDEDENYNLPIFNLDELGAGALRSTRLDLAHYLIAHMNNGMYQDNQILTEESINLMHNESQAHYGIQLHDTYGFGWMNEKIINVEMDGKDLTHFLQGHGGRVFGFNSLMFFNQDAEIGVILFINQGFNFFFQFDNTWDIFDVLYKEGLLFRNQSISSSINASGVFIFSLTIVVYVFFIKYRSRKSRTE
ncbi:MAG: serine hydrolase domain-containing protein [Candidatus Hodarchaeales archaeon]|jgi:CubicO group peptidase (beta-lactamase class C family)